MVVADTVLMIVLLDVQVNAWAVQEGVLDIVQAV